MRALVIGMIAIALLAGCSGGGGDGNSGRKAAADPTADHAAAEKIGLRQADFPSGWTSAPHNTTPQETATLQVLTECIGIPDVAGQTSASVHSPDFTKGREASASSIVTFAKTDADASIDLGAFQSSKGPDCLKQAFEPLVQRQLPGGLSPSNLEVHQLAFPTLKDGTAAYQATFTVSVAGTNIPLYIDFIYIRAGRAGITVDTTSTGSPFDPKLEESLARKIGDRS